MGFLKRRVSRLFEPSYVSFYIIFMLMAVISLFAGYWVPYALFVAAGQAGFAMILLVINRRAARWRRREITRYLDTLTLQTGSLEAMAGFPLPAVLVRAETGEVVWNNDQFSQIAHRKERLFETRLDTLVPGFDLDWLVEGQQECPSELRLDSRLYTVYGTMARTGEHSRSPLAMLYWIDSTELSWLRREITQSRPMFAIVMLDNYEELTKNLGDGVKSALLAAIDQRLAAWAGPSGALLRKYDRDRYFLLCEHRHFVKFIEGKFAILDSVRELSGAGGIPATLSIGVGKEADSFGEGFAFAQVAIDMALSRGGDQVVLKGRLGFEFYGGRSKELEKRTKVKSRVMANTLAGLISDASCVMVMGHKAGDLDSLGAAAGMVCAARSRGKPAFIVITAPTAVAPQIERLRGVKEYAGVFLEPEAALARMDRDTLLVVVDTHRPDLVESEEVLRAAGRVAVIDHHRRAAMYIDRAVLSFHEPYASSACELVTELLQYMTDAGKLLRAEAEALLAGIVLDTKNFSMHTGVRTFEAAAYLRGAGADTVEIKRMFQTDLHSNIQRYNTICRAEMVRGVIAVSAVDQALDRVIAAQAADEMLAITGVQASFVLFPLEGRVLLSARSMGGINVQVIVEKLGGGGHQSIAGAQLTGVTVIEAKQRLLMAIQQYFEECGE